MADSTVTRVLFVCHGNICRSPMAQCIFQNMVDESDIGNRFIVDSAATTNDEIGMPIYPPAKEVLQEHGVAVVPHRARKIQREEVDLWDHIVCMDDENLRHLRSILGDGSMAKVSKLMSYTGYGRDVADPWYTRDFEEAYDDIFTGCEALLEALV